MNPTPADDLNSTDPERALCEYCERFQKLIQQTMLGVEETSKFYVSMNHQPSLHALQASADEGCDICKSFNANILAAKEHREPTTPSLSPVHLRLNKQSILWEDDAYCITIQDREHAPTLFVILEPFLEMESSPATAEDQDASHLHLQTQCFTSLILPGRSVDMNPLSERTLAYVMHMLTECLEKHDRCRSETKARLPRRVVDVGSLSATSSIRLITDSKASSDYLTLSHCWGSSPHNSVRLTRENESSFQNGISEEDLPLTYRDAIKFTRLIGVRYLWIDSLCILQNDIEDWAEQSAAMSDIYSGALLSISACAAESNESGFLQLRKQRLPYLEMELPCSNHGKNCLLRFRRETPTRILENTRIRPEKWPLDRRGWTLQEMLLPRRQVRIDADQASWICRSVLNYESYAREIFRDFFSRGRNKIFRYLSFPERSDDSGWLVPFTQTSTKEREKEELLYRWAMIVTEFSGRELTYPADKLPALSGLASSFNNILHDQYVAGLWLSDFPRSLLWVLDTSYKGVLSKHSDYRAPSFSWASVDGYISPLWQHSIQEDTTYARRLTVEAATITPAMSDLYGRINAGELRVKGFVKQVRHKKVSIKPFPILNSHSRSWAHEPDVILDFPEQVQAGEQYTLLQCMVPKAHTTPKDTPWVSGLIISPAVGETTYQRIGVWWQPLHETLDAKWSLQTLTIV